MDEKADIVALCEEQQEGGSNPRKRIVIETKKTTTTTITTRRELFVDPGMCMSDIQAFLDQTDIDAISDICAVTNACVNERTNDKFRHNEETQPLFSSTRVSEFEQPSEETKPAQLYSIKTDECHKSKSDNNSIKATKISTRLKKQNNKPRKSRSVISAKPKTDGSKSTSNKPIVTKSEAPSFERSNRRYPKRKRSTSSTKMAKIATKKKAARKSAIDDMINTYASMVKSHHNSMTDKSKRNEATSQQPPAQLSQELPAIYENPDESMESRAYDEVTQLEQHNLDSMENIEHLLDAQETEMKNLAAVEVPRKRSTNTLKESVKRQQPSTNATETAMKAGRKKQKSGKNERMAKVKPAATENHYEMALADDGTALELDGSCGANSPDKNIPKSVTNTKPSDGLTESRMEILPQFGKTRQRAYDLDKKSIKIYSPSCRNKFKLVNGNHVKITKEAIERAISKSNRKSRELLKRYHAYDVEASDDSRVVIIPGRKVEPICNEDQACVDPLALARQRGRTETHLVLVNSICVEK